MSGISIEDRVHENERRITELINGIAALRGQINELVREYYE